MSLPPGWYKDPDRPRLARYWDGDRFVGQPRRCRGAGRLRRLLLGPGLALAAAMALAVLVVAAVSMISAP